MTAITPEIVNTTPLTSDIANIPLPDNIAQLPIKERNYLIMYLYIIRGVKQVDLASIFGIAQNTISIIISELKEDTNYRNRAISVWQKDFSMECLRAASKIVDSIDENKMPEGSKAISAATLMDKAMQIHEVTSDKSKYSDMERELKDIEQEERDLARQLGYDQG